MQTQTLFSKIGTFLRCIQGMPTPVQKIIATKTPHFQKALDVSFHMAYPGYLLKNFATEKKAFVFA